MSQPAASTKSSLILATLFLLAKPGSTSPAVPQQTTSPHQPIHSTVYFAVIASICATLLLLCLTKLLYLQLRQSESTSMKLNRLWLEAQPSPSASLEPISSVEASETKGSPFLLGFLGSPARELGYVAKDLVRVSWTNPRGERHATGQPMKDLLRMTRNWIKEPWPMQVTGRFELSPPTRRNSSDDDGELPIQWPVVHSPSLFGAPDRALSTDLRPVGLDGDDPHHLLRRSWNGLLGHAQLRRHSSGQSTRPSRSYLSQSWPPSPTNLESPVLPLPCRTPDRRRPFLIDTSDVIGTPSFATSEVLIEGNDHSPWLPPFDLGPPPGHTFLENLESGSPMPLRFRLPSPLLPTRKKSGSSKSRSPLRSIIFSQTSTVPSPPSSSDSEMPLFVDILAVENEKVTAYNNIGLGRPSQSPISFHHFDMDKENNQSPTLEHMLDQLVQATSDWDDSLFVDDKFKHLVTDASSKKDKCHLPMLDPPLGAVNHCDLTRLPVNGEACRDDDHGIHSHSNPLLQSPYGLRDRRRDLLFSIPEEEAISFSDVVIQTC